MIFSHKAILITLIIFLECCGSKPVAKMSQLQKANKYLKKEENCVACTKLGCKIFNALKSRNIPKIKEEQFNEVCEKVRLQVQLRLEHEQLRQDLRQLSEPIFNKYYAIVTAHPFDISAKQETFTQLFATEQGYSQKSSQLFMKLYNQSGIPETNKQLLELYNELIMSKQPKISAALKKAYEDLKIKTIADLLQHS